MLKYLATEDTEFFIFSLCSRYNVFSVTKNEVMSKL